MSRTLRGEIERLEAIEADNQQTVFPDKTRSDMMAIIRKQAKQLELTRKALSRIITVKEHKDREGKDEWYEQNQPEAWRLARYAFAATNPNQEGV